MRHRLRIDLSDNCNIRCIQCQAPSMSLVENHMSRGIYPALSHAPDNVALASALGNALLQAGEVDASIAALTKMKSAQSAAPAGVI